MCTPISRHKQVITLTVLESRIKTRQGRSLNGCEADQLFRLEIVRVNWCAGVMTCVNYLVPWSIAFCHRMTLSRIGGVLNVGRSMARKRLTSFFLERNIRNVLEVLKALSEFLEVISYRRPARDSETCRRGNIGSGPSDCFLKQSRKLANGLRGTIVRERKSDLYYGTRGRNENRETRNGPKTDK